MRARTGTGVLTVAVLFPGLASCGPDTLPSPSKAASATNGEHITQAPQPANDNPEASKSCSEAFEAAAKVNEYQDTHEDLFPAYFACRTIEEWKAASAMYPKAIDGVDPIRYAMNVCAANQARLGAAPVCQAVNKPQPPAPGVRQLEASKNTGLLGVPLPKGARLIERTPGDPSIGRDASERYAIEADIETIEEFFSRELPKAGWAKAGDSTETWLFFERGRNMIGVIMNRKGGTFTLMGS